MCSPQFYVQSSFLSTIGSSPKNFSVKSKNLAKACQTLPGLPRAARPCGRFPEG